MTEETAPARGRHQREIEVGHLLARAAFEAERLESRTCQVLIEAALYGVMQELQLEETEVWPHGIFAAPDED